jgi:hypothetical protein
LTTRFVRCQPRSAFQKIDLAKISHLHRLAYNGSPRSPQVFGFSSRSRHASTRARRRSHMHAIGGFASSADIEEAIIKSLKQHLSAVRDMSTSSTTRVDHREILVQQVSRIVLRKDKLIVRLESEVAELHSFLRERADSHRASQLRSWRATALRQKRSLSALLDRGVVIWRSVMRSLYRGLFVHLDSLWRFSYVANTIIHVCFSKVSRPRDSDHSTSDEQARLAPDAWPTAAA